eukprot:802357-Rhodomonas_salina.5
MDVHIPDIYVPNVHVNDVHIPDVSIPEIHVADVHIPDIHVNDVSVPDIAVRGMTEPTLSASPAQLAQVGLAFSFPQLLGRACLVSQCAAETLTAPLPLLPRRCRSHQPRPQSCAR